jgi:hypothetical protein
MGQCPTTRSRPGHPPLKPLNYCWCQHWVDCCTASSNVAPLRPRPRLSLYFLMGIALAPYTRKQAMVPPYPMACALHGPMGSHGVMSWGHRYSTHRERAKLLEGSAAAAHFGCVCSLFLLYTLLFSHPYIPGCTQGCTTHIYSHNVLVWWNYGMSGFTRGIEKAGMGSIPACICVLNSLKFRLLPKNCQTSKLYCWENVS